MVGARGRQRQPLRPGLGALAGALSGRGHPLSPRECPRRPLTPARHLLPVTRGPLPPWSLELWGRAAGHWAKWLETRRPLRPDRPTAKIRKGVAPYGWKNRGEAPRRWHLAEPQLARFGPRRGTRQVEGRQPHQEPPSGQRAPPWTYQACFTGSLGSFPWNWKLSPPPRGPILFPCTPLASPSPTPQRPSAREEAGAWGREQGPATVPGQVGPARGGGTQPRDPVSRGVSGL